MNTARRLQPVRTTASDSSTLRVVDTSHALRNSQSAPSLVTGQVTERTDQGFLVRAEGETVQARRAVGCLLEPDISDRVLLLDEGGVYHILNILERTAPTNTLSSDRELRLQAPAISMEGPSVSLRGMRGTVSFLQLDVTARDCRARIKSLSATLNSIVQRAAKCLRIVGLDSLTTRRSRTVVRERWSVHAESAELTTDKNVKVDGEQILLG